MTAPELRRASAHALVDDVEAPALSDPQAHHVFRVLRVRDGETVTVTDGVGRWRACEAVGGSLSPAGEVQRQTRRSTPLTVLFAIPKQDRPEWIVQKLTELGIDRIVPIHAERSVVQWGEDRIHKHMGKLRRVAREALQQSRGVWLPEIAGPMASFDVLPTAAAAEPGAEPIGPGVTMVAIGPEGGWSPAELGAAATTVSIASRVLRVETAAVAAGVHLTMHAE